MQAFELARGEHNLRPMEGLRGFAVALVFLVHYVSETRATGALAEAVTAIGNAGVDLFFVLSGYLIWGNLIARPQAFGRFMERRLRRLYPVFAVVFAIYLAASLAMPSASKIPHDGSTVLYLLANFLMLPGLFPIEPMIAVAWSLSYEVFYYLAAPLVIGAFAMRRWPSRDRVLAFAVLALASMAWCSFYAGHVRLTMFLAGILVYELRAQKVPGWLGAAAAVAALAGLLVYTSGSAGYVLKVAGMFAGFGLLCAACFSAPRAWLGQAFSWAPLRWLGNMSYSYYLIHGLALKAAFSVLGTGPHWLMLPLMFAISLLPAAAMFLAVERPFSLAPAGAGRVSAPDPRAA